MATPKKVHKGLDHAVLQKMTEPLSVRVVKIKNNSRQPVNLPGKDGAVSGTGWARDDVLEMERFVQNQEGGGPLADQIAPLSEQIYQAVGSDEAFYPEMRRQAEYLGGPLPDRVRQEPAR